MSTHGIRVMHRCLLLRTRSATGAVSDVSRCRQALKPVPLRARYASTESNYVPRIAQPSFWDSIIPRAWRNRDKKAAAGLSEKKKRAVNPASYFIWMSLLIGSQAMRLIGIHTEFNTFIRKADLKIDQLRDVVDKLQRGEKVDVEKVLGTGDEAKERDWEQALEEIKNEEMLWQINKKKIREEKARRAAEGQDASPINESSTDKMSAEQNPVSAGMPPETKFY